MRLQMLGHIHGLRPANYIHGFTVRLIDVAVNDDFRFAHRFFHKNGQGVLLADLPEGEMALLTVLSARSTKRPSTSHSRMFSADSGTKWDALNAEHPAEPAACPAGSPCYVAALFLSWS